MVSPFIHVAIHPSQFPEAIRAQLLRSLRERRMNHKFHYDTVKQAQRWLDLHEAWSPARTDPACLQTYDRGFAEAAAILPPGPVHVVGLGCGGGEKDLALLRRLHERGTPLRYTPCDVSLPLVLVSSRKAYELLPPSACAGRVCDLGATEDLSVLLEGEPTGFTRVVTFFGMMPNFEPGEVLPKLRSLLRAGDALLLSANLAPGPDYIQGMQIILPQYDNAATREWLLTVLLDLGVDRTDGDIGFEVQVPPGPLGLRRVVACFRFERARVVRVEHETFAFSPGDRFQLFFSYRHTPELLARLLGDSGLQLCHSWITPSGEEGVFLART